MALLAGCVQQVLAPQINWATLRVLARNGVETVIPRGEGCCGSLSLHIGEAAQARDLARRNLTAFPADVDAIITNAAGCGSGMHEYGLLFAGEAEAVLAEAFGNRVRDISVFLDELGIEAPPPLAQPVIAAYHDACHLAHAQRVTAAATPPVEPDSQPASGRDSRSGALLWVGGNLQPEQPELARAIGERKGRAIVSTGAAAVDYWQHRLHESDQNTSGIAESTAAAVAFGEVLDWAYGGRDWEIKRLEE